MAKKFLYPMNVYLGGSKNLDRKEKQDELSILGF